MSTSVIGEPITRIDGRLKVTGGAKYAADCSIERISPTVWQSRARSQTEKLLESIPPSYRQIPRRTGSFSSR